jgi:hypothetical protein
MSYFHYSCGSLKEVAKLFLQGLFRYAIIHSGSPIAHWFISDCVQSSRKRTYPSDCKPGTSRFTKRRPTYYFHYSCGSLKEVAKLYVSGEAKI